MTFHLTVITVQPIQEKNKLTDRVFLTSGLGNSLFQYVFAKSLGPKTVLVTGLNQRNWITKLIQFDIHDFDLEKFDLPVDQWSPLDVIALAFLKLKTFTGNKNHACLRIYKTKYHFGYFQKDSPPDLKSIKDVQNLLRTNGFLPSKNPEPRCVIHVRHGDFSEADRLSLKYYERAMAIVIDEVIKIDFKIIGFGADVIYHHLKTCFGGAINLEIVPMNTEVLDFEYIANSSLAISSNSTFCFWAAMCGEPQIIIMPGGLGEMIGFPKTNEDHRQKNLSRIVFVD